MSDSITKQKATFQLIAELRSRIADEVPLKTLEELHARIQEEERNLEKQKQVYEDEIGLLKRLADVTGDEAKFRLADAQREIIGLRRKNLEAEVALDSLNRQNAELKAEIERLETRVTQTRGDAARTRSQWVWNVETLAEQRELLKREVEGVEKDFARHLTDWAETVVMMREKSSADKSEVKTRLFDELYRLMARQKRLIVNEERSLMAGLAQFVQNQVGGLGGTAQLLKERVQRMPQQGGGDAGFIADLLKEKARAIETLEEGLRSFAELNHPQEVKAEKRDLAATLAAWAEANEALFKQAKLDIEKDLTGTVPVPIDPNLLDLALKELARNAAENGATSLKIRTEKDPEGAWMGFSVEDNGPGIAPHLKEKVFQPFFTTRKDRTGLGLSKALRWISIMGGELTLAPSERGAKFSAKFPVYESVSLETP